MYKLFVIIAITQFCFKMDKFYLKICKTSSEIEINQEGWLGKRNGVVRWSIEQLLKKSYLLHVQPKKYSFQPKPWPAVWRSLIHEKPREALCWVSCQSNRFSTSPRPVWSVQEVALTIPHRHTRFPSRTRISLWPDWAWCCCPRRWVADALMGRLTGFYIKPP